MNRTEREGSIESPVADWRSPVTRNAKLAPAGRFADCAPMPESRIVSVRSADEYEKLAPEMSMGLP